MCNSKIVFILVALLVWSQKSLAQNRVDWGLKVHPLLSWIDLNDADAKTNGAFTGISYGVLADIHLVKNYSIASGLAIYNAGAYVKYKSSGSIFAATHTMNYLAIPIALKYKSKALGRFIGYGQLGISSALLLASKLSLTQTDAFGNNSQPKKRDKNEQNTSDFRLGLLAEAGIQYILRKDTRLQIGLAYNGALNNALIASENGNGRLSYVALVMAVFF